MQKQRFLRGMALWLGLCLMVSFVRAQEAPAICDNFTYKPIKGQISTVTFGGLSRIEIHHDYLPHQAFDKPHWVQNRLMNHPVAYVAGTIPAIEATFNLENLPESVKQGKKFVWAKGTCKKIPNMKFPVMKLIISGDIGTYPSTAASIAFTVGEVVFFNTFNIDWEISFKETSDFQPAGTSYNPLYVSLSDQMGCHNDVQKTFYSTIHYACNFAENSPTTNSTVIFDGIWNNFKNLQLSRIEKTSLKPNPTLQYWGGTNLLFIPPGCRGIEGLLDLHDANCGEWAGFMASCLGFHKPLTNLQGCKKGILIIEPSATLATEFKKACIAEFGSLPSNPWYPIPNSYQSVFLVKDWEIPTLKKFYYVGRRYVTTFFNIPQPYYTNFTGIINTPLGNTPMEKGDLRGVPAHGNTDPQPTFNDHALIRMPNNKIYDPSYGTGPFNDLIDWEAKSLDGYAFEGMYIDPTTNLRLFVIWPYQHEDKTKEDTYWR
jgi:hypothetical protein